MAAFLLRRLAVMVATALCLTFVVFFLTNLEPNLEKVAKSQGNARMSDAEVASWLDARGYDRNVFVKYGEWLGILPGYVAEQGDGTLRGRCFEQAAEVPQDAPRFCGVLQGDWGYSTVFRAEVSEIVATRLGLTAKLMGWVLALMVPAALIVGILAGMREGSRTDRALSSVSILSTATPEYVSGVLSWHRFLGKLPRKTS